jgi:hypothetical protein
MNKFIAHLYKGISILLMTIMISSCKKDEPIVIEPETNTTGTVEIRFVPTMNGQPFQLNSLFSGPNGKRIQIETFKSFFSEIAISSNGNVVGKKDIELIDFGSTNKSILISTESGSIDQLEFGIGVNKTLNGTNNPDFSPSSFASDHPLSIYNGMYWTWASGYIFFKIEGRIDTSITQDQSPIFTCFYHVGLDTLYSKKSFNNLNLVVNKGQTTIIEIAIEFNDSFIAQTDTINMIDQYFTHTSDNFELATKVIGNFKSGLRRL